MITQLNNITALIDLDVIQELCTTWMMGIIGALAILILGSFGVKLLVSLARRIMDRTKTNETLEAFCLNLIKLFGHFFVYVAALSALGIETTSILAMVGAAGLAIGLALQGMLSSFAAGVLIIFFEYFQKDDFVEVCGIKGTVLKVEIFNTVFLSEQGHRIIVPNNKITLDKIIVHSTSNAS